MQSYLLAVAVATVLATSGPLDSTALCTSGPSPTPATAGSLAPLFATNPQTANKHNIPQNMIIRISSPATDLSITKFKNPLHPVFLRAGQLIGRRSLTYFFRRSVLPRPHGQTSLLFSCPFKLTGRPCWSVVSVNEPLERLGVRMWK